MVLCMAFYFRLLLSPPGHFENCDKQLWNEQFQIKDSFITRWTWVFFLPFFLQAIHAELSKLVKRQSGGKDTQEWKPKAAEMLGDNITPFLIPSRKKEPSVSLHKKWRRYILFIFYFANNTLIFLLVFGCCVLGTFLEVYTGSSGCGLGQLSDINDSDCKKLKSSAGSTHPPPHHCSLHRVQVQSLVFSAFQSRLQRKSLLNVERWHRCHIIEGSTTLGCFTAAGETSAGQETFL